MKKLLIFLMLVLPVVAIAVLNLTISVVAETISIPVEKVEFEQQSVVTNIDDDVNLKASVYPINATNKLLVWESSDTSVLVVDTDGNITFVGFGSAYVTVTSLDGNKKASCYFVVTDTSVHQVVLYTIGNIDECKVGDTLQIYAEILPYEALNKEVVFSSSNQSVATISNDGLIHGISAGTTTIVAQSVDGSHISSMEIEIYENITSFDLPSYVLTEQSYYQLDCRIQPFTADITKIDFSVDNPDIANVSKMGKVMFNTAGSVLVTAQYEQIQKTCIIEFADGYICNLDVSDAIKTIDYKETTWQIGYTTRPVSLYNTDLNFVSSDNNVATVSDTGLVTLEGGGVCTISIFANKYDNTILQKDITLFVTRDCEQILSENITTATADTQLQFSSLPEDNTCSNYYFYTNSSIASVNNEGIVSFCQIGSAEIIIFGNSFGSEVSKTVVVNYTGGYATDFYLEENVALKVGESILVEASYYPTNTIYKELNTAINNQTCSNGNDDAVISLTNGYITALRGGSAVILVSIMIDSYNYLTKSINIEVEQVVSDIQINTGLESINDTYLTGNQIVNISNSVSPLDANKKLISYTIDDINICQITGSQLVFNYPGTVLLIAKDFYTNVQKTIKIKYTNKVEQTTFEQLPTSINVGDTLSVNLQSYIPSNLECNITLQKTSESTKSQQQVVSISGNEITGISGGFVNISVYVSGSYRTSFTLQVIRLAQSIDVLPKNVQVNTNSVLLNYTLSPIDSTCNNVLWQITESDIAFVSDNVLTFTNYGLVHITATVCDENMASQEFTIERILPSSENISVTEQNHEMFVGEYLQIANESNMQFEIISDETDILIHNISTLFYANRAGNAVIRCIKYNDYNVVIDVNEINVQVYNYVRNITLNEDDFDYYNGEYVTASSENDLNYILYPNENIKNEVQFEVNSSIAQIIAGSLVFYTTGIIDLKATSIDGNCTRVWKVRYTGGYAVDFELNVDDNFEIAKGQSTTLTVNNWIPQNTTIKTISIQTLTTDASNYISVDVNKITAYKGGIVQILVRASNNLTKILTINVVENIESIDFGFDNKTITEMTLTLSPIILPATTTIRNVYYVVDQTNIATVNNGILTFSRPGTINLLVFSSANSSINDSCFITCTAGYPTKIVLNSSDVQMLVGDTKNIFVSSYTPSSARTPSLKYELVYASENNIISISNEGKITALASGSARIKVSVINNYELDISAYVNIEILKEINSISVDFEENLDIVNGVYFTAKNNIAFNILAAGNITNNYTATVSNEAVATVNNNNIYFKTSGLVTITFVSSNNTSIKKVVSINYTNNNCISASVNESAFAVVGNEKQITKNVGEEFEFNILEVVPQNVSLQISLLEVSSTPNASGLSVASIVGNKIVMQNGGTITYRLYINSYLVGEYKFVVVRYATNINVAETEIYISTPVYNIIANVYPLDSSNQALTYTSSNTQIAQVNALGEVEFYRDGTVSILIKNQFSNIEKTITIRYTRSIEKIVLSSTKTTMPENSTLTLTTQVYPSGINDYHIEFFSSDVTIATVDNTGKVISKAKEGEVTITAYLVENHNITATITLNVTSYITNIALELDTTGDNRGIAGIRVFGREFIDVDNNFYNTYQMNILNIVPNDPNADLVWSSSDNNIATVDNNGLVTFVSTGIVTIRVEPRNQFNINRPIYDSYTFNIVNGVNIYNFDQFMLCNKNAKPTVFQSDAILTSTLIAKYNLQSITITKNIYGNGNMLSLTGLLSWYNKLVLQNNGIVLDNLTFRGEELGSDESLSSLSSKNVLMIIWKSKDIVIKNCIFENSCSLIRAYNSEVLLSGCIFRNAGFAHVILSHEQDTTEQTIVTTKNCIFKDALLAAIVFDFDKSTDDNYISKLVVLEGLYIYNFRQPNEMNVGTLLANYVPSSLSNIISANMTDIFSFYNEIKHTYEGKTYYHLGIISIGVNYYLDSYLSKCIVDMTQINQPNPYREFNNTEIKAGVTFVWKMYTVMPNNTIITPSSTYDSTVYSEIRDNS